MKKAYDITAMSAQEFIAELERVGSRVYKSAGQWTIAWLKAHNLPYRKFERDHQIVYQGQRHKTFVEACINYIKEVA